MKFLRHLLGITKLDKEKNKCTRQKTGAQNIVKEIKRYQKKWLQHVQRMDTNRLPKQALQYKPKGRRNIGRPRKRWRDQLHLEDQGTGNTPNPSGTWWWWWWWCLKCLQHIQRMDTNRLQKQALRYKPKGRPRKRWKDQLHLEDQGTGNTPDPSGTWWWWWWWWRWWWWCLMCNTQFPQHPLFPSILFSCCQFMNGVAAHTQNALRQLRKQDRHCASAVTMRRVRTATLVVEEQ